MKLLLFTYISKMHENTSKEIRLRSNFDFEIQNEISIFNNEDSINLVE